MLSTKARTRHKESRGQGATRNGFHRDTGCLVSGNSVRRCPKRDNIEGRAVTARPVVVEQPIGRRRDDRDED